MNARAAALAALLLACASANAQQQNPDRKKALLEGTHVFRRILHDHDCSPLQGFDELDAKPEDTVLIVLGGLDRLLDVPGGLRGFVEKGGAVLIAGDRPPRDPDAAKALADLAGVGIADAAVLSPRLGYHGLPYCPRLFAHAEFTPRLFRDKDQDLLVYANVPSHLTGRFLPRGLRPLAFLPPDSRYDLGDGRENPQPLGMAPFLVGGEQGKGRLLVAADHSVFINEMMLPEDTNNVEFSYNCVRYLCGDRPRSRVLMLDEGGIQTTFDVPLRGLNLTVDELLEMLRRNPEQALALADAVANVGGRNLVRMERDGTFARSVDRLLNRLDSPRGRLFTGVALASTLALAVYGFFRLGMLARFAHDTKTPTLSAAVAKAQPTTPLVQQRNLALLNIGRMNEPAAQLARRWLIEHGLGVPDGSSRTPPAKVDVGWWAGLRLRGRLSRVWRLAAGDAREKVTAAGLWRLRRELESLSAARRRGDWGGTKYEGRPTK